MTANTLRRIWKRQGYAIVQDDPIGLQLLEYTGIDDYPWGNDYPHHAGTWPHSRDVMAGAMSNLTDEQRAKVLGLNAATQYRFEVAGATM